MKPVLPKAGAKLGKILPGALARWKAVPSTQSATPAPAVVPAAPAAPSAPVGPPPTVTTATTTTAPAAQPDPDPKGRKGLRKAWKGLRRAWKLTIAGVAATVAAVPAALATHFATTVLSTWDKATHPKPPAAVASRPSVPAAALPPLTVDVVAGYDEDDFLALPKPLTEGQDYSDLLTGSTVGAGSGATWDTFLTDTSGAAVGSLHLTLTLTDTSPSPITVTDIRVKSNPPEPKLTGTLIPIPHAGGGGDNAYLFSVNLDAPAPALVGIGGQQSFPDFHLDMAQGSNSTVSIQLAGTRSAYSWTFLVDYLDPTGTRKTYEVKNPDGGLFRLTGQAASYQVQFAANFPAPGYRRVP